MPHKRLDAWRNPSSQCWARRCALRRSRGLTPEGLAEELHVTTHYLAGVERGERNLTLHSVDALAEQLGLGALSLLAPGETPVDRS